MPKTPTQLFCPLFSIRQGPHKPALAEAGHTPFRWNPWKQFRETEVIFVVKFWFFQLCLDPLLVILKYPVVHSLEGLRPWLGQMPRHPVQPRCCGALPTLQRESPQVKVKTKGFIITSWTTGCHCCSAGSWLLTAKYSSQFALSVFLKSRKEDTLGNTEFVENHYTYGCCKPPDWSWWVKQDAWPGQRKQLAIVVERESSLSRSKFVFWKQSTYNFPPLLSTLYILVPLLLFFLFPTPFSKRVLAWTWERKWLQCEQKIRKTVFFLTKSEPTIYTSSAKHRFWKEF